MAAYHAALAAEPPPIGATKTPPGSMTALVVSWYASAEFARLAPSSKATYRRIVERFLADHGRKLVADLESKHVRSLLDTKAGTPAAANRLLSILKLLMRHAVERGWRADDPTLHIRKVRYSKAPYPQWTEEDIARFEARWPLGTRARLALALLLYTGQRRSDVIRMGRQHIRDGLLEVTQAKTNTRLGIPIHPALQAALDACPVDHLTFLMTEQGRPFASGNAFYNWFVDCARKAGLAEGLSPHGLRKSIGRRLVEAGCTPHQVAAITGHKTLSEVERYTRDANQEGMARTAIGRIGPRANG
jgi:integrase